MTSVLTLPSHMSGFLHELGSNSGVYSYVSRPTMLVTNKPKIQHQVNGKPPNIMFDKRVVRGSTYTPIRTQIITLDRQRVTPTDGTYIRRRDPNKPTSFNSNRKESDRKRRRLPDIEISNKPSDNNYRHSFLNGGFGSRGYKSTTVTNGFQGDVPFSSNQGRVSSPRKDMFPSPYINSSSLINPVPGRKHSQLQTEKWLEEITNKVEEANAEVQTDPYTTPSVSPREESRGTGLDKETQIYPLDPELFNFDSEVGMVLEGILGRTMEQSILEVLQEEETALLRKQKLEHQAAITALSVL
ncbi:uncharacterized protein LOC111697121 isoform X2 [Eurytemora carolleeae]|nr:uncharacterized protein LOC111697121 isoform X2 [Eurytemora carolleeae]XP_023322780.1 uncharacterized protein LOC111697121 isoform X2 [Eurytemora carolleeae]|eukprot:XP_023322779.1 uncharacterized protein LOC111697121 isoform X2 [Eurytemora affinis]